MGSELWGGALLVLYILTGSMIAACVAEFEAWFLQS